MPPETMTAWINLYAATFILAALCAIIAVIATVAQIVAGKLALPATAFRDQILLLPRIWLRWQINYLHGTPAVLAIAIYYASDIGFAVLGNV